MDRTHTLLGSGIAFGRNIIGITTRPYETYRRIVDHGSLWELVYIGLVLAVYFALASLVKTAAFRPFLLTQQFVLLYSAALLGFLVTVLALWLIGTIVGGVGKSTSLALGWAYTLIPTVTWFLATSLLYVVLPPPRTTSVLGISFSIVFLLFSAMLFWWKLTLAYLTLRFGMRLDLGKIIIVAALSLIIVGLYSRFMYTLGIFTVPFI
ncbi:hypothetical protein KBC80_05300 [Candidatus Woesebacteria bacterium]|jgi:hypothetical protein|nr:hypothetical protein [Candidatus Woesebacteria bacterium]